jgi:hypothetical protein
MRLPNADGAEVDSAKVRDYLLAPEHPVDRAKARVFAALGFTRADWPALRGAPLALARDGEAAPGAATVFGQKWTVRGTLRGPAGRSAPVVTAWIVLAGEDVPRLVTAYPGEEPA